MTAHQLRPKPLSISESLELDLKRAGDVLRFRNEQIRLLKLANQSLSRVVSPEMLELLDAAQAWKDTYPRRGGMDHLEASQRLMAAIEAVEESKQ